jgi:tetratricopeptide (TPR) repeat protein
LTLRQAQEALKTGRLEEAHRLVCQPGAQGHKGSWELLQQVARAFVERGQRHLQHEDVPAAWNDLLQAEQIGVSDDAAARLRQALIQRGLAEAEALLDACEPGRALDVLGQMRNRSVQQPALQLLEEAAKGWVQARELAARGEFAQALHAVEHVRCLRSQTPVALTQFQQEIEENSKKFAAKIVELHEAVAHERWRDVVRLADEVLAMAPQQAEARKARARAWKTIEPSTVAALPLVPSIRPEANGHHKPSQRFLLWIDGIGGYLVCLGTRVTLGQATPDAFVDVPLFADVSRLHASLTRDTEGYLLEALRPVQVNGQAADKVLLRPGDRVTLGTSCQFQFCQPVPVSATARLDMVSGHRLPLAIDRVLLMADTLVLGPGTQAHVSIPELQQPVILFRQKDGIGVRHAGNLVIDGQPCRERGLLGPSARVSGDDFCFAVEPVGRQLGKM